MTPPRILLVSSGLEHARRGYESFARECFEALRGDPGLDIQLIKGSGPEGQGERSIPSLRRDRRVALAIGRALGARPYRIEAFSFAFSVFPLILRRHPDIVFLSEWDTARGLAMLRSLTRQRFKLVLSNGGFAATGFEHLDHVQELTPAGLQYVLDRGADPQRHSLLPYGFHIEPELPTLTDEERDLLRHRLGLPADREVLVSVAALNRQHKRLDYLIQEVARLPRPRPFLLMVGQPDSETPEVRALAKQLLEEDGYDIRTVPASEVGDIYRASDTFVLASVAEAQGRVLIEAMSRGLPCVAHDSEVMQFALGPYAVLGDLTQRGVLTQLLEAQILAPRDPVRASDRHRFVYERFSWDRLRPRYVQLLTAVARREPLGASAADDLARSASTTTSSAVRRDPA